MRKQHYKEREYIEWLKSLGCVFYAPLDEEHGLTELISNTQPTIPSGAQVYWDSTYGMYRFKVSSTSSFVNVRALTYSIASMGFENGGPISLLVQAKKNSSSNTYNSFFGVPDFYNINTSQKNCAYICEARYRGVNASNLNKYAHTVPLMDGVNPIGLKWYFNGTLYTTSNWTGKVVIGSNTVAVCQSNRITGNFDIYVKEAMIFNKALDLQTIREIQG